MAKEIKAAISLSVKTGLGTSADKSDSKTIDMAGTHITHNVQDVGAGGAEALVEGADLGTPGIYYIKNLDGANYVSIGLSGQYSIKLKPGEFCLFRAAAAIYALANTASCKVEYMVIED
mgnify:CR=1 FL=1|tara:strand:- start:4092 stop:4448 length:357 start_codon:yes stop_codon:yes gene_type:complete